MIPKAFGPFFSSKISGKVFNFFASVFCASLLIFFIIQLTPGLTEVHNLSDASKKILHMDQSAIVQYLHWVKGCLTLDFGIRISNNEPVIDLIKGTAFTTIYLTVGSLLLSILLSIPISIYLATRPDSKRGKVISSVVYGISSVPVFVVGYIVLGLIFSFHMNIIRPVEELSNGLAVFLYYVVPLVVLALGNGTLGEFVRVLTLEIQSVNASLFIKAARSRGVALFPQFIKPVILPFLSIVISRFAVLVGGVIVVEKIFNRRGMGELVWSATSDREFFIVMAISLLTAVIIRLLMLLHDVFSYYMDPRLRG